MVQAAQQIQSYFQLIKTKLDESPDGIWLGGGEHQASFSQLLPRVSMVNGSFTAIEHALFKEPILFVRYDALRLLAKLGSQPKTNALLDRLVERAGFDFLIRRRVDLLKATWKGVSSSDEIKRRADAIRNHLWFTSPGATLEPIQEELKALAALGEPGLYQIDLLLGEVLDEGCLMPADFLFMFKTAAKLFVEYRFFEGVQVFFDFLADCAPLQPSREVRGAVKQVLKAVRKLRPYRYPKWAMPLKRFVQHYKKIGQAGRAAEANMLIILISASEVEEALLLDDDELVDLLRGRRDAAYSIEELSSVAQMCDAVLAAGRNDARIFHIRGWLAARLDGPDAATPFFHKALSIQPDYVYSHLALSALYEMRGDDSASVYHLQKACGSKDTLISCHRKYGEIAQDAGRIDEAIKYFVRGTQIKPVDITNLELEEFFGCFAALAHLMREYEGKEAIKRVFTQMASIPLIERFGARFVESNRVVIGLLQKGMNDLQIELSRNAA